MKNIADIRFAEMLTTKFCHDIAGPVGAVNNGVEFLADPDPEMQSQAIKLIANSSAEAMVRLQFYRMAYGVNTSDSSVSLNETRKTVVDFFNQAKPQLVWPQEYSEVSGLDLTSLQRKIIMNLMLISIAALPRGGKVEFSIGENDISVTASGEAIKFSDVEKDFLTGKKTVEDIDSRTVQTYYTYCMIESSGKNFEVDSSATKVIFKFSI
jgi:histidine phosphotransferase ChpT